MLEVSCCYYCPWSVQCRTGMKAVCFLGPLMSLPFLHVDHVSSSALDWIGAMPFSLNCMSLSTFLFLLFLNAFFTACNYRVVIFLQHFTPKKRFPVLLVYCLYPDISQLWKTKNLVACLFKWVMNKELLVTKL